MDEKVSLLYEEKGIALYLGEGSTKVWLKYKNLFIRFPSALDFERFKEFFDTWGPGTGQGFPQSDKDFCVFLREDILVGFTTGEMLTIQEVLQKSQTLLDLQKQTS